MQGGSSPWSSGRRKEVAAVHRTETTPFFFTSLFIPPGWKQLARVLVSGGVSERHDTRRTLPTRRYMGRIRPRRGRRWRVWAAALALALAGSTRETVEAQDFSTAAVAEGSASASGDGTAAVGEYFAKLLAAELSEGERRLAVMAGDAWTEPVCGGQPMVMLKSDQIPANGACLPQQTLYNLSCTCLTGYEAATSWEFSIKQQETAVGTTTLPTEQSANDELGVTSVMTIDLPEQVRQLKIIGASDLPEPVTLKRSLTGSSTDAIARSTQNATLTTLDVANVDLSQVTLGAGFVPPSVQELSISNCNVATLGNGFLDSFSGLISLNMSFNRLSSVYSSLSTMSPESIATVRSIDLSSNKLTSFPSHLLQFGNLQMLNVSGNPIDNFTITSDVFARLTTLAHLTIDPITSLYNCSEGEWKSTHNISFCVVNTVGPEVTVQSVESMNSGNWRVFLLVAAIGGCLIGFVLLFLALRLTRTLQRQSRRASIADALIDPAAVPPTPDGSRKLSDTVDPTLNIEIENDPIMVAHRIPYRELRLAKCISKGGFGLVYSGIYARRRVAIKRIHPDRSTDAVQIRQFVHEIALMATLNHPRIVEFLGVAWDSLRNLSSVTEYMERGDLRDVLHTARTQPTLRDPRFTWADQKLKIALHIAEALMYLHSLNPRVIHRDLKSKNVLLNTDMDAKLSDFGISRERKFDGDTHMTAGIGTSFWIAPEILLGKDYDERADIYSFGVVLSEIDTDDYPYWNSGNVPAEEVPGARKQQENELLKLVAVGKLRPTFYDDCPREILALAATCLEGRPDDRPSAAEVVLTLERITSEHRGQLELSPASVV